MAISVESLRGVYLASLRKRLEERIPVAEIEARIYEAAAAGCDEARWQMACPRERTRELNLLVTEVREYFGVLGFSVTECREVNGDYIDFRFKGWGGRRRVGLGDCN